MIRQSSRLADARALLEEYPDEAHQQAFAYGYNNAHGIACHCRPEVGTTVYTDSGLVDVAEDNFLEVWEGLCYEAEQHSRCYSPWEHIAARINDSDDPESLWEAYEAGVTAAISHDIGQ